MNNLLLQIDTPTPPKRTRKSLVSIRDRSRTHNYSLRLPSETNPQEMQVCGSTTSRTNHSNSLINKMQAQLPLTSRRNSIKHLAKSEKNELPCIFTRGKSDLFSRYNFEEPIPKPKREFEAYLTHIKSQSDKFTVCKPKNKEETEFNFQMSRTIQYLFLKLAQLVQKSKPSAKDLCVVYLSLYEKSQLESYVSTHLPQPSMHKLFALQRLICYYMVVLNGSTKFQSYTGLFIKASCYFHNYFSSLADLMGKRCRPNINSTVRSLKLLCEIDKGCQQVIQELKQLTRPLSRELYEAQKQLTMLINDPIGNHFLERLTKLQYGLNWKLFKVPPIPYLPPCNHTLTVILELDNTLTYYDQENKMLRFRPHLEQLLDWMLLNSVQVILFTIMIKDYADKVVESFDPQNKYFEARLYNQHTTISEKDLVKDVGKLGRNLARVIALDSYPSYFKKQPQNLMAVSRWRGRQDDQDLKRVLAILKTVVSLSREGDVRGLLSVEKPLLTHISEEPEETIRSDF